MPGRKGRAWILSPTSRRRPVGRRAPKVPSTAARRRASRPSQFLRPRPGCFADGHPCAAARSAALRCRLPEGRGRQRRAHPPRRARPRGVDCACDDRAGPRRDPTGRSCQPVRPRRIRSSVAPVAGPPTRPMRALPGEPLDRQGHHRPRSVRSPARGKGPRTASRATPPATVRRVRNFAPLPAPGTRGDDSGAETFLARAPPPSRLRRGTAGPSPGAGSGTTNDGMSGREPTVAATSTGRRMPQRHPPRPPHTRRHPWFDEPVAAGRRALPHRRGMRRCPQEARGPTRTPIGRTFGCAIVRPRAGRRRPWPLRRSEIYDLLRTLRPRGRVAQPSMAGQGLRLPRPVTCPEGPCRG